MTDHIKKLIAEARSKPSLLGDRTVVRLADALEAEHQQRVQNGLWLADEIARNEPIEAERDALRTAIQDAIRELEDMPSSNPGDAHRILSRAIDTKEKP